MADKKIKRIQFELNPPRPENGTGDIVVPFGDTDDHMILKWSKGNLVDVLPHPSNTTKLIMSHGKIEDDPVTTIQGTSCFKCARNTTTGETVCWDVPC